MAAVAGRKRGNKATIRMTWNDMFELMFADPLLFGKVHTFRGSMKAAEELAARVNVLLNAQNDAPETEVEDGNR